MNLFDIVGPVMVGPSSSHTAGAVRIGFVAQKLLGEPVIPRFPNGATRLVEGQSFRKEGERGELKHLSTHRRRKQK